MFDVRTCWLRVGGWSNEIRCTFVFLMNSAIQRNVPASKCSFRHLHHILCIILRFQALVSSHFSLAGVDKPRPERI